MHTGSLRNKLIISIILFIIIELSFTLIYKTYGNYIFENKSETENRYYNARGVLKPADTAKYKVAAFGGSSAAGYGSTISFTEILNNISILSNQNIRFDNHATPATPFYLYQAEKIKKLINDYDAFIIYAGHNEWLHFDHKKNYFPNNQKTTNYNLMKKHWINLLEEEIKIFKNKNYYFTGGNLIFNTYTDKVRILNFAYRVKENLKEILKENYKKYFINPSKNKIKEIRFFYDEKFFDKSNYKEQWLKNFVEAIKEIDRFLPPNKKLIIITPISNLVIPPIGDYAPNYNKQREKKMGELYNNFFKNGDIDLEYLNQIEDGSHKNYLLGNYCLSNYKKFNINKKEECIKYLVKSKNLDELPIGVIKPIQDFIINASKFSKRIEVIDITSFQNKLASNKAEYEDFFLDNVHPSKKGHAFLANQLAELFFENKVEVKVNYNKKMSRCPDLDYFIDKKLVKTFSTFKSECDKKSNLIDNWHRHYKSFTMKETHYISENYIKQSNF